MKIGLCGTQITSSISVDQSDKNLLSSSFDIILDIVESGTGSIPTIIKLTYELHRLKQHNRILD